MPSKPLRFCGWHGCCELTDERFCPVHKIEYERQQAERNAMFERRRGNSAERGYDSRWRKSRIAFLNKHPLCAECARNGRTVPATVVDHIVPHKGDKKLFWDRTNWQPLCKSCHDRKTAREDGRWGRGV